MSDWNPSLYLHFSAERSRPAVELLARVPLENVEYVADLGCGPGNSTALLQQRWPAARITGIDSSPAMIAEARSALPVSPDAVTPGDYRLGDCHWITSVVTGSDRERTAAFS